MPRAIADTFNIESDEIVRYVSKLYLTRPRQYALTAMVHTRGMEYTKEGNTVNVDGSPMGVEVVDNPKFEMQRDEIMGNKTAVNNAGGYSSGDTSIAVDDGSIVPKYALLYVARTGEIMRVSSVSSNTLTVTRSEGNTTAATINDNDDLHILGTAYAENAVSGDASFKNTEFDYNYTQIDREQYGNSRTEQGTKKYGISNRYDHEKRMALIKFLRRWNQRMWLGGRDIDTSNKFRTTGGILSFIDSGNLFDAGDQQLQKADFDYFLRKYAFAYNGEKKTLFASSTLIERINAWAEDKNIMKAEYGVTKFGLAVRTYFSAWGELDIVYEPMFDEYTQGTNPLSRYGVVLDLSLIKVVYFVNGILKAYDDIQENDRDGRKGEWLMEGGVQVNIPKAHAIIRNV